MVEQGKLEVREGTRPGNSGYLTSDTQYTMKRLYRRFKDHDIVWYDPHHRMMAADIHYTRERLGALRFNLLTAFRMLNEMDQKLWENEYRNWLLDQRVGCDEPNCSEILKEFESL